MKSIQQWHKRFQQQADWTKEVRDYLFQKAKIKNADKVIDIGCGTGVLLKEFDNLQSYGIDINYERLLFAKNILNESKLACANALQLPFEDNSFDHAYFHYFLLWASSQKEVLHEIKRITKPGGKIISIAEPDYSKRLDFPDELVEIGKLQTTSLSNQGADPFIGSSLKRLFLDLDLKEIEFGVIKNFKNKDFSLSDWNLEWKVLQNDIENYLPQSEIDNLKNIDLEAWKSGERILYIPTFYAIGTK